jgi:hypothetical protein
MCFAAEPTPARSEEIGNDLLALAGGIASVFADIIRERHR